MRDEPCRSSTNESGELCLEVLGGGEEGGEVGLAEPHLPAVDEGEDGGEVVARDPGQVETEGAGRELGQDAPQFLALRGENHLQ